MLELTSGRGVDHVIEVGGPDTLPQSIQACRIGGHIALIGVLTGVGGVVPTVVMMLRQQRVLGLIVGSRQHQIDMVRGIDATGVKPVIDRTFALRDIRDSFRALQGAQHVGKICVEV